MQNGPQTIRIYSIFRSINGEMCLPGQGSWATFIRFAGCNLRCEWCDTKYAQDYATGSDMGIGFIIDRVKHLGCRNVTITGGEPLMQPNGLWTLIRELIARNHKVSIETNGSRPIPDEFCPFDWDRRLSWVVDYKLPSSGEQDKMLQPEAWSELTDKDFFKFVIANLDDYIDANNMVHKLVHTGSRANFVFSPIIGSPAEITLLDWMQNDNFHKFPYVRVSYQLHKLAKFEEPK